MSDLSQLLPVTLQPIGNLDVNAVSARMLYAQLGLSPSNWSKWYPKNIINNQFAEEHKDWEVFVPMTKTPENGRPTRDFFLHVDFAKKLAMAAHTEEGERVKDYFLSCERLVQQGVKSRSVPGPLRPRLSAAMISKVREHFGHHGTTQWLIGTYPEMFGNLAGPFPQGPQQVVTPTLGLIEDPLASFSEPKMVIPPKTLRAEVEQLVKGYAAKTDKDFGGRWNMFYGEVLARLRVNLKIRAKNQGFKPMDVAEQDPELMGKVHALAVELFGKAN